MRRLDVTATKRKLFHPPGRGFGTVQSDGATASKVNPAQANDCPRISNWFANFNGLKLSPCGLKLSGCLEKQCGCLDFVQKEDRDGVVACAIMECADMSALWERDNMSSRWRPVTAKNWNSAPKCMVARRKGCVRVVTAVLKILSEKH